MQTITLAMPFDLIKSGNEGEMRIGGYASTSHRDRQGESVIQKSLDISEFVTSGFFNLDHDGSKILGYPDGDRCRIDSQGLYVEGTLLKGVPEAESIYRTAVALQKSNTTRRLGFSVEGQVLERNGAGLITKARVYNVAITARSVNPNCTWDALCKSFAPVSDGVVLAKDGGPTHGIADAPITYAETEAAEPGLRAYGNGAPLIPESLETAFRSLADIIERDDEDASMLKDALREMLRGRDDIRKSELALYFALSRGLPLDKSITLANTISQ